MTALNVLDFIGSVGKTPVPPLLLFCAARGVKSREATFEPYLAEQAVDRVIRTCVDPSMKDLAFTAFYADEAKASEIVIEAQTVPFLAERRVVLVRNAEHYAGEAGTGPLLTYLDAPCEMTILMLVAAHVDKRTRFYKACEKNGVIVECPELGDREVLRWIRAEVEARGKRIDPGAAEEILRRAGTHLSDVNNAINGVIGYIGDGPVIREADVAAACADVAEEEVWALTDAIAESRPDAALMALRKLLDMGRHEDELLGIINWLLKSAYAVAVAVGPPQVSAFVVRKVQPLAGKLGVKKLRDAFALCTDTHFMIRSTGVDSALALELLVVKLAAPVRRAQSA